MLVMVIPGTDAALGYDGGAKVDRKHPRALEREIYPKVEEGEREDQEDRDPIGRMSCHNGLQSGFLSVYHRADRDLPTFMQSSV